MENLKLTPELIKEAKNTKSVEELILIAKAAGIILSTEDAEAVLAQISNKTGELSDTELDNVAGGGCSGSIPTCPNCNQITLIKKGTEGEYTVYRCWNCENYCRIKR